MPLFCLASVFAVLVASGFTLLDNQNGLIDCATADQCKDTIIRTVEGAFHLNCQADNACENAKFIVRSGSSFTEDIECDSFVNNCKNMQIVVFHSDLYTQNDIDLGNVLDCNDARSVSSCMDLNLTMVGSKMALVCSADNCESMQVHLFDGSVFTIHSGTAHNGFKSTKLQVYAHGTSQVVYDPMYDDVIDVYYIDSRDTTTTTTIATTTTEEITSTDISTTNEPTATSQKPTTTLPIKTTTVKPTEMTTSNEATEEQTTSETPETTAVPTETQFGTTRSSTKEATEKTTLNPTDAESTVIPTATQFGTTTEEATENTDDSLRDSGGGHSPNIILIAFVVVCALVIVCFVLALWFIQTRYMKPMITGMETRLAKLKLEREMREAVPVTVATVVSDAHVTSGCGEDGSQLRLALRKVDKMERDAKDAVFGQMLGDFNVGNDMIAADVVEDAEGCVRGDGHVTAGFN